MSDVVWSYAIGWETLAKARPDQAAIIQGKRTLSWAQLDAEADALAAHLLAAGLKRESKVAAYLYNCPEFIIAYYGAFKASLAPFNVNYRYGAEELFYLFENADAEAVVFHTSFAERIDAIRARLPLVKSWIVVAEPGFDVPAWADDYATIAARVPAKRPVTAPGGRSNEDVFLLYTGGTTGMPKGVVWRASDMIGVTGFGGSPVLGIPPMERPEQTAERAAALPPTVALVSCPMMHATGMMTAFIALFGGGTVVLLEGRHFDAEHLWDEVANRKVTGIALVGLAFATPMIEALQRNAGRWDLSSVRSLTSSGAMLSNESKQALLAHMPGAMILDTFSSSEALGMGLSVSTAGGAADTAKFIIGPNCAVFTEDHRRVEAGSGESGMTAVSGFLPMGYYKDEEKTKRTFPVIDGQRWSMPGDWATVGADGSLQLLGRGSQCINTGGEKVFPEEVEEALKLHPAVRDAAVVGAPDARFGERICAVIELNPDAREPTLADVAAHVKTKLADYKAPRALVVVESINRAPNGKLDYKAVKARALADLQARA